MVPDWNAETIIGILVEKLGGYAEITDMDIIKAKGKTIKMWRDEALHKECIEVEG